MRAKVDPDTAAQLSVSPSRIRHIVLAVNKMDLVDYEQSVFDAITADYTALRDIGIDAFTAIPISGINGDNITSRSDNTPWFDGPVLMDHLEDVPWRMLPKMSLSIRCSGSTVRSAFSRLCRDDQ